TIGPLVPAGITRPKKGAVTVTVIKTSTIVSPMKTGALTRCRAASQKNGLIPRSRRRNSARATLPRWRSRSLKRRRLHQRMDLGRSRQVRPIRQATSASQVHDSPSTAAKEIQYWDWRRNRTLSLAESKVWSGLNMATKLVVEIGK